jgi:ketosteroid isomerase-like protein
MRAEREPLRWAFVNNDPTLAPDLLHEYIDGWRRQDIPAVLATLAEDCVVIKMGGPVHRGRERVEQWMLEWFGAGGVVHDWQVTGSAASGDLLVAEWVFTGTWRGERSTREGVTLARPLAGRIAHLREYAG